MKSYKFEELFNPETGFVKDIEELIPKEGSRMGDNPVTFGITKRGQIARFDFAGY